MRELLQVRTRLADGAMAGRGARLDPGHHRHLTVGLVEDAAKRGQVVGKRTRQEAHGLQAIHLSPPRQVDQDAIGVAQGLGLIQVDLNAELRRRPCRREQLPAHAAQRIRGAHEMHMGWRPSALAQGPIGLHPPVDQGLGLRHVRCGQQHPQAHAEVTHRMKG
jgi:hypothetical protein